MVALCKYCFYEKKWKITENSREILARQKITPSVAWSGTPGLTGICLEKIPDKQWYDPDRFCTLRSWLVIWTSYLILCKETQPCPPSTALHGSNPERREESCLESAIYYLRYTREKEVLGGRRALAVQLSTSFFSLSYAEWEQVKGIKFLGSAITNIFSHEIHFKNNLKLRVKW